MVLVADTQRKAVGAAAARIGKAAVADKWLRRPLAYAHGNARLDRLAQDKGFEVGAKLRHVFGLATRRIVRKMGVDEALRHRRVYVPRGRLPDQNWIAILAVVLAIGVTQSTAPAVRRRGTQ